MIKWTEIERVYEHGQFLRTTVQRGGLRFFMSVVGGAAAGVWTKSNIKFYPYPPGQKHKKMVQMYADKM